MRVYVVLCNDGYSRSFVVGVYPTEEQAIKVCEQNLDYYYEDVPVED
jgi:hypothetical protein